MNTDLASWAPPRCSHDHIILACPHDDCLEQTAYLDEQRHAIDAWADRQQAEARRIVRSLLGLPPEASA